MFRSEFEPHNQDASMSCFELTAVTRALAANNQWAAKHAVEGFFLSNSATEKLQFYLGAAEIVVRVALEPAGFTTAVVAVMTVLEDCHYLPQTVRAALLNAKRNKTADSLEAADRSIVLADPDSFDSYKEAYLCYRFKHGGGDQRHFFVSQPDATCCALVAGDLCFFEGERATVRSVYTGRVLREFGCTKGVREAVAFDDKHVLTLSDDDVLSKYNVLDGVCVTSTSLEPGVRNISVVDAEQGLIVLLKVQQGLEGLLQIFCVHDGWCRNVLLTQRVTAVTNTSGGSFAAASDDYITHFSEHECDWYVNWQPARMVEAACTTLVEVPINGSHMIVCGHADGTLHWFFWRCCIPDFEELDGAVQALACVGNETFASAHERAAGGSEVTLWRIEPFGGAPCEFDDEDGDCAADEYRYVCKRLHTLCCAARVRALHVLPSTPPRVLIEHGDAAGVCVWNPLLQPRRHMAALRIHRMVRDAMFNPAYELCRRRLQQKRTEGSNAGGRGNAAKRQRLDDGRRARAYPYATKAHAEL